MIPGYWTPPSDFSWSSPNIKSRDENYEYDVNFIKTYGYTAKNGKCWLASRYMTPDNGIISQHEGMITIWYMMDSDYNVKKEYMLGFSPSSPGLQYDCYSYTYRCSTCYNDKCCINCTCIFK